jgi:hypothetical protein
MKTVAPPRKAAEPRKPRKSAAQQIRELPLAEKKRRFAAMCEEVETFWKGKPDTGAVSHLLKLRRGQA